MKVAKNSWHYRMNEFVYYNSPCTIRPDYKTNLCDYFWHTIFNIPQFIFALIKYVLLWEIPKTPRLLYPKEVLKGEHDYDTGALFLKLFPCVILFMGTLGFYSIIGLLLFTFLIDLPTTLYMSKEYGFDTFVESMSPASIAIWLMMEILLISIIIAGVTEFIGAFLYSGKRTRKNGILYNYIKAWKEKNCPLIEFTDE